MDSMRLAGKVAVVTGASKGIGASIAKQLAAEGAAVVVNYASSKEGADQVVNDITALGGKAIAVQGDVASPLVDRDVSIPVASQDLLAHRQLPELQLLIGQNRSLERCKLNGTLPQY